MKLIEATVRFLVGNSEAENSVSGGEDINASRDSSFIMEVFIIKVMDSLVLLLDGRTIMLVGMEIRFTGLRTM